MDTETVSEAKTYSDVALVTSVERGSPAEQCGLMATDLILIFGKFGPTEILEEPERISQLAKTDRIIVSRHGVLFRILVGKGIDGCVYERGPALDQVSVPEDDQWLTYNACIQNGAGLLLIPEQVSFAWSLVPVVLLTRFHLWQMLCGVVLVYCVAFAMDPYYLTLAYGVSVVAMALGGVGLLIEGAAKQGYVARGQLGLTSTNDVAALEVITATLWRLEREKALAKKAGRKSTISRQA